MFRLKRFDKSSFKSGPVEKSTSSGKDGEFGVTIFAGTKKVFQKMLSNSRVMANDLSNAVCLAGTLKMRAVLRRIIVLDRSGTTTTQD